MFTTIITWAGALLGIAIIVAMAFGSLGIDFDARRARRRLRGPGRRSLHKTKEGTRG